MRRAAEAKAVSLGSHASGERAMDFVDTANGEDAATDLAVEVARSAGVNDFWLFSALPSLQGALTARAGEVECQAMLLFPADGGKFMREFRRVTATDPAFAAAFAAVCGVVVYALYRRLAPRVGEVV